MTRVLRFARKVILGVVILYVYLTVIANILDYKLSKQLDDVDPTNEEMVQNLQETSAGQGAAQHGTERHGEARQGKAKQGVSNPTLRRGE